MSQLEVLHENKDYIVINKTAGLISEQSPFEESTAESLVQKHLQTNKRMAYVGVIHRLDRVTSGVLIFAKKKNILVAFNEMFSSRKVKKNLLGSCTQKASTKQRRFNPFFAKKQS